jgi:pyridoxal phosphate enzyme (YggS family)
MGRYEKAWQVARQRIEEAEKRAQRARGSVRLLAVSKTFPAGAIRDLHGSGQRAFGENYVQEASAKREALADLDIEWHLIGPLQSNKTRLAAACFDWIESVDRMQIADRLAAARGPGKPLDVLVQVNASGEATKHGVAPSGALALALHVAALPTLRLRGIMGIPEVTGDDVRLRDQFRQLKACYDACTEQGLPVDTLSMGMSSDLELAIAEGSTEVRIGTAIFGMRDRMGE